MEIRAVPITSPDAAALVEAIQQEYVVRYGGRDETPVTAAEFGETFFVGYEAGTPVASGGWRSSTVCALGTDRSVEIKRMYVTPEARGRGHARAMLAHLERTARQAGAEVVVLESGDAQPEAIGLYLSVGYEPIDPFGHYAQEGGSRYFARRLWFRDGASAPPQPPPYDGG